MTQATQQPVTPGLVPAKVTLEQYRRIVDAGILDDCKVELLHGIIVEMSPEGPPHASKRTTMQEYLMGVLGNRAQIRVGAPITLPNDSEPEPDIAIVQRVPDRYLSHHPYPENIFWVVEYSNTSLTKDLGVKVDVYAIASIPEYWVVNLQGSKLITFRDPMNGHYQSRQEWTSGSISPIAFPDVAIDVAQLLG